MNYQCDILKNNTRSIVWKVQCDDDSFHFQLGNFPTTCLGNFAKCDESGFAVSLWLHMPPSMQLSTGREQVILQSDFKSAEGWAITFEDKQMHIKSKFYSNSNDSVLGLT